MSAESELKPGVEDFSSMKTAKIAVTQEGYPALQISPVAWFDRLYTEKTEQFS